jgi:hypothetical protein
MPALPYHKTVLAYTADPAPDGVTGNTYQIVLLDRTPNPERVAAHIMTRAEQSGGVNPTAVVHLDMSGDGENWFPAPAINLGSSDTEKSRIAPGLDRVGIGAYVRGRADFTGGAAVEVRIEIACSDPFELVEVS